MIGLGPGTRIFVYSRPADMRRSFDSLSGLIAAHCPEWDAMSGAVFVFTNGSGDRMKALWWDRDGWALWYKRLERGTFALSGPGELTWAELCAALEGVEVKVVRRRERYSRPSLTS